MRTTRIGFGILPLLAVVALLLSGCPKNGGNTGGDKAVTQQHATQLALARVQKDAVMTIDSAERDTTVTDEGDVWHVSFPYKESVEKLGGEPHVLINKKTGDVVRVYYTQ